MQQRDEYMSNTIVEAMARALFVSTYVDWAEEMNRQGHDVEIACCGSDWMDVAPETTREAQDLAWYLLGRIEQANGTNIWALAAAAWRADFKSMDAEEFCCDRTLKFDKDFGHCLAMMAMGSGVGWWDDHVKFPLEVPYIETAFEVGLDWPVEKEATCSSTK
jgi:hypothetical protein